MRKFAHFTIFPYAPPYPKIVFFLIKKLSKNNIVFYRLFPRKY